MNRENLCRVGYRVRKLRSGQCRDYLMRVSKMPNYFQLFGPLNIKLNGYPKFQDFSTQLSQIFWVGFWTPITILLWNGICSTPVVGGCCAA